MPLQKEYKNNASEFNSFDYKISMFKNAMYAHVGVYTYTPHAFLYDSALLVLRLLSCALDTCA